MFYYQKKGNPSENPFLFRKEFYVIRLSKSIISRLARSEVLIFLLVSVAEETGLKLALSETPKTGFLATSIIDYWQVRSKYVGLAFNNTDPSARMNCSELNAPGQYLCLLYR